MEHLGEVLAAAAREMQDAPDLQATMDAAIRSAVDAIDSADEAGISLLHARGRIENPAVTSAKVRAIDDLQLEYDEGPCLEAVREQAMVYSPDLGDDDRWLRWGPEVVESFDIRSMLCFRLFTDRHKVGALNLYSRRIDGFDDEDVEHGMALAAHVGVAVAASQEISQLTGALGTRLVIGQAQGILMERFGIDAERAFTVMQRVSMGSNAKLRDIAATIVETRRLPGRV